MHDRRSTTAAHMPWLLPLAALATIGATPAGERDAGAVPLPFGRARLALAAEAGGLVAARVPQSVFSAIVLTVPTTTPAVPSGSRWRLARPSARETAAVAVAE